MGLRVLWVTDEVPDYGLGGGSIRQYHLLRRLSERADVDLLMVGELPDPGLRRSLRRVIEVDPPKGYGQARMWFRHRIGFLPAALPAEVATVTPTRRALEARLAGVLSTDKYDVVQIEHETLAPLAQLKLRAPGAAWAITLHSLLSTRLRQWADDSARARVKLLLRRDAANADRLERWIMRSLDLVMAVSPSDVSTLGGPVELVPNGVDLARFRPTPLPAEPRLILSGSWNWPPNVDSALLAANEILPRVQRVVPGATLALVGRNPTREIAQLAARPGVETHFDVPSVVPFLQAARVALVPIRVGSGTRLKALEAMAAGRPVVGTRIGLDGLDLVDREQARLADSPDGMAAAIVELLGDDALASQMAASARRHVEAHFGWDAMAEAHLGALMAAETRR